MRGLENILASLRDSLSTFTALHTELADLHEAVCLKHGGTGTGEAVLVVVGAGRGVAEQPVLMPPPAQCLDWMRELDRLYCRELLLHLMLGS